MKVSRTELIKLVTEKIRLQELAAQRQYESKRADYLSAKDTYVSTTRDAWIEFSQTIQKRVSTGVPMSSEDIPRVLRGRFAEALYLFNERIPQEPRPTLGLVQLRSTLDILNATADDYISTYTLEKMGIKLADLT